MPQQPAATPSASPRVATDRFVADTLTNPANAAIVARLPELHVAQPLLVAGALFQTVWNLRSGQPPGAGIRDYDVFYFDPGDLSWEAEDRVIRRGQALFGDLGVTVEIRNQARVPLWFEGRFGAPYPPVAGATEAVGRFIVECTCVGLTPMPGGPAPVVRGSLDDLYAGRLRCNPHTTTPRRFPAKAEDYRRRWPWLTICG